MAKFKIHTSAVSITAEQLMKGKNGKVIATKAAKAFRHSLLGTASAHYAHAVKEVGDVLENPGVGNVLRRAGRRAVRFKYLDGRAGRIVTALWSPLSEDYARHAPASTTFWRKTGRLAANYRLQARLPTGVDALVGIRTKVLPSTRKGAVAVRNRLEFVKLRPVIDGIVRQAFVEGAEVAPGIISLPRGFRQTLDVMVFPERSRPMVSRLSAALGRDFHRALKKVKVQAGPA